MSFTGCELHVPGLQPLGRRRDTYRCAATWLMLMNGSGASATKAISLAPRLNLDTHVSKAASNRALREKGGLFRTTQRACRHGGRAQHRRLHREVLSVWRHDGQDTKTCIVRKARHTARLSSPTKTVPTPVRTICTRHYDRQAAWDTGRVCNVHVTSALCIRCDGWRYEVAIDEPCQMETRTSGATRTVCVLTSYRRMELLEA